jgi:hypothetical protein
MHGLRIRSEIPLDAPAPTGHGNVDLEILAGQTDRFPGEPPSAQLLCEVAVSAGTWRAVGSDRGCVLSFERAFAFAISGDGRLIIAHVGEGDPALVPVLLAGNVLGFALALRGVPVLHASAVADGETTFAFAGASGAGKTTLAAMLCAAGARLVSDDALRLKSQAGSVLCYSGTTTLRLRQQVAHLAKLFPPDRLSETPDGRIAVAPDVVEGGRRLDAVVILSGSSELRVSRLAPRNALVALLSHPRWFGWKISEPLRLSFQQIVEFHDHLPVYSASIPSGPQFPPGFARHLLAELAAR